MLTIDNWPLFYFLMTLHCVIGTAAALVAKRRGLNFRLWLGLGWLGGTLALIAAFLVPVQDGDS